MLKKKKYIQIFTIIKIIRKKIKELKINKIIINYKIMPLIYNINNSNNNNNNLSNSSISRRHMNNKYNKN